MGERARERAARGRGAARRPRPRRDARSTPPRCTATAAPRTIVGEAIAGRSRRVFLVSKVLSAQRQREDDAAACERSLARLRIDRLDLLSAALARPHPLAETVDAFERPRARGQDRALGRVQLRRRRHATSSSRFPSGKRCAANQVLYHLASAAWSAVRCASRAAHMACPLMAYSPLGAGRPPAQSQIGIACRVARRHAGAARARVAARARRRHRHSEVVGPRPSCASSSRAADHTRCSYARPNRCCIPASRRSGDAFRSLNPRVGPRSRRASLRDRFRRKSWICRRRAAVRPTPARRLGSEQFVAHATVALQAIRLNRYRRRRAAPRTGTGRANR